MYFLGLLHLAIPATSQRNSGIEVAPLRSQHCHLTRRVPTCQSWQAMTSIAQDSGYGMRRAIDWKHAFFIAAGVPALVLFSMGAISATIGAKKRMTRCSLQRFAGWLEIADFTTERFSELEESLQLARWVKVIQASSKCRMRRGFPLMANAFRSRARYLVFMVGAEDQFSASFSTDFESDDPALPAESAHLR